MPEPCSCSKTTLWPFRRAYWGVQPAPEPDAGERRIVASKYGLSALDCVLLCGHATPDRACCAVPKHLFNCRVPTDGQLVNMIAKPAAEPMHCSEALLI